MITHRGYVPASEPEGITIAVAPGYSYLIFGGDADAEVDAIAACVGVLGSVPADARARAVRYLDHRFDPIVDVDIVEDDRG